MTGHGTVSGDGIWRSAPVRKGARSGPQIPAGWASLARSAHCVVGLCGPPGLEVPRLRQRRMMKRLARLCQPTKGEDRQLFAGATNGLTHYPNVRHAVDRWVA